MNRHWLWELSVFVVMALSLLLGACGSPSPTWSTVFIPAPAQPMTHAPRREAYKPFIAPTMAYNTEMPAQTDWPGRLALLPKDANDAPDWVRAVDEKLIQPKPGLDDKAEDEPILDLDVVLEPKDLPDFAATYPHRIHTTLLACTNCHTEIFQMEKGADPITMEKIFAGEYCGRCHGKVAFDVATGCPRCHLSMPK